MNRDDCKGSKPQIELYSEMVVDTRERRVVHCLRLMQGIYIYSDPHYGDEISFEVTIDGEYCGEIHDDLDDAISAFNRLKELYGGKL